MKHLLAVIFLVMSYAFTNAQVIVNDVNINELEDVNYIEISCKYRILLERFDVRVDIGKLGTTGNRSVIKNSNKQEIRFISTMHVLNFFDNNGWDLVQKETLDTESDFWETFLMKKEE